MIRIPGGGSGFDLVGTAIGTVPLDRVLDGSAVADGDVVIGLASSGIHSNGLTLARRVLLDRAGLKLDANVPYLGTTLAEELLRPTHIYVKPVLRLLDAGIPVHALAHITGDGLFNLTRVAAPVSFRLEQLPESVPAIFGVIQERGEVEAAEMSRYQHGHRLVRRGRQRVWRTC